MKQAASFTFTGLHGVTSQKMEIFLQLIQKKFVVTANPNFTEVIPNSDISPHSE
jgi:hypothetical protein